MTSVVHRLTRLVILALTTIKLLALNPLKSKGHRKKFYVRSAAVIVINRPTVNPRKSNGVVRRPTGVNFKLFSAGSIGSVKVLSLDLLVLLHQGKPERVR